MIRRPAVHLSQLLIATTLMGGPAAAPPPSFDAVMAAAKPATPCTFDEGDNRCHGFPHGDLWANRNTDAASAIALAKWVRSLTFVKTKPAVFRPPSQALEIAQIDDIEKVWLQDVSTVPAAKQAVILARISADLSQPPDDAYGAGKRSFPVYRDFYIVLDGYAPDKVTYKHDSYKAGTFSIYTVGVVQGASTPEERLVQVGKLHGKFRICAAMHSQTVKDEGAQFLNCDAATRLSALVTASPQLANALGGRSLYQAIATRDLLTRRDLLSPRESDRRRALTTGLDQFITGSRLEARTYRPTLLQMLVATSDAPGWMPCGVGCCTADDR